MATNTATLKTFAQETRKKLISLITTKLQFVLNEDTAELRGYEREIGELRKQIREKTEKIVIEEVAYTWFNRVMALRFMDANGYSAPMIVTPAAGQTRPEILQDAMSGSIDDELKLKAEEKLLPEAKLYRKLLVAVCNKMMAKPMPFLFEHISDYTELLLPDDLLSDQSFVSDIRNGMTDQDCQNVEIMGWLYQFYITDRKADAETKKSKKGGLKSDEQAAATQLFTPHWIVRYMVENSLGRIWMTLHPDSSLIKEMPYYIATPDGQTDTIPEDIHSAKDIRFLDPCMGSGHILVYAFDLLAKMYEEEGEQAKDIPALILENNLYGIDIDRRCYQLASFALTMKARAYYRRYLRNTVMPHVIALEKIDRDIIESAGSWDEKSLMWQFENIDTIGSLLKVTPEECAAIHIDNGLFGERQRLLKTQAEYLSRKYHCVVTNPPYLGKGFCEELKNYVFREFPNSKSDTMAMFMERCYEMLSDNGKYAMINMQSWMFMPTYESFRKESLKGNHIDSLLHLGKHAFDEINGEVVQSVTFVMAKNNNNIGEYYRLIDGSDCSNKEKLFFEVKQKQSESFVFKNVNQDNFSLLLGHPIGYWISPKWYDAYKSQTLLQEKYFFKKGMSTGDNPRFLRQWYEVSYNNSIYKCFSQEQSLESQKKWYPINSGGTFRKWYGNQNNVVNWLHNGKEMKDNAVVLNNGGHWSRYITSIDSCFIPGLSWNAVSTDKICVREYNEGFLFCSSSMCGFGDNLKYAIALLNSCVAMDLLYVLAPSMNYGPTQIKKIPLIQPYSLISPIETITETNISISKLDWDSHETSWDFLRNPLWEQQLYTILFEMQDRGVLSENATIDDIGPFNLPNLLQPLEILVENYKSEWEDHFHQLHRNEEELNRKFIEIYGLQDELTPDVPLDEITILQKGEISIEDNRIVWHDDVIIKQFISWLVGCFMGRYSADKPGLIMASQGQKVEDLDLPIQTLEIDEDGIIPVVLEEDFFADDLTQRVEAAVKTLLGEKHFHDNMKFIKQCLGQNLRDYLYKNFYADHQQMYSVKGAKRPIYWLFSSQMGDRRKKGYFKALVYMHRLEADTLSKLHADYVHPYIQKVEQQLIEAEDNANRDDLNQAQHNKALKLAEELREKVREVKAFETALVEMASARVTIDLDDGVKTNYPKFYPLVEPIKGLDAKDEE